MATNRAKPLSSTTTKILRDKAKKSVYSFGTLKKVFRRGQGAFLTAGSRPGIGMQDRKEHTSELTVTFEIG